MKNESLYNEIVKLKSMLEEGNIPFEIEEVYNGHRMAYPNKQKIVCSIIEHDFSIGNKYDMLEIMGLLTEEEKEDDCVKGYLTAEDVFNRINNHYNK